MLVIHAVLRCVLANWRLFCIFNDSLWLCFDYSKGGIDWMINPLSCHRHIRSWEICILRPCDLNEAWIESGIGNQFALQLEVLMYECYLRARQVLSAAFLHCSSERTTSALNNTWTFIRVVYAYRAYALGVDIHRGRKHKNAQPRRYLGAQPSGDRCGMRWYSYRVSHN